MIDEPHVENCQGCVANRLTETDRAHLIAHGWTHPGHTYRVPEEMPPRPQKNPGAGLGWFFGILPGGVVIMLIIGLPTSGVVVGVAIALWLLLLLSNHHHHRNHPRLDRPNCRLCKRQAAQIWAHYDAIKDRQERRSLYTKYQHLQENERRYDQNRDGKNTGDNSG